MKRKIRSAAVIGSGVMGGGIAALLAAAGVKTLLLDIVPFDLKKEEKNDSAARNRIVKAGLDALLGSSPALLMQKKDVARISIGNLEDDFEKIEVEMRKTIKAKVPFVRKVVSKSEALAFL